MHGIKVTLYNINISFRGFFTSMSVYEQLKTGEKRSYTSSIKKAYESFILTYQNDILQFETEEKMIEAFYQEWVKRSRTLSWSKNEAFKNLSVKDANVQDIIRKTIHDELLLLNKRDTFTFPRLRPLKSKKKRLVNKRKKHLEMMTM